MSSFLIRTPASFIRRVTAMSIVLGAGLGLGVALASVNPPAPPKPKAIIFDVDIGAAVAGQDLTVTTFVRFEGPVFHDVEVRITVTDVTNPTNPVQVGSGSTSDIGPGNQSASATAPAADVKQGHKYEIKVTAEIKSDGTDKVVARADENVTEVQVP